MKLKGYFYGCLSAVTYGLIPLFAIPLIDKGFRYESILFYRFMFAAILLAIYLIVKKESLSLKKSEVPPILFLGVLFALSSQFLFWSYNFLSVSVASTLLFVYPIFVAILMNVIFKERISIVSMFAIALAFSGILILSGGNSNSHVSPFGIILILSSALSYAIYIIIVNKSKVQKMSGFKLTFYALLISCLFFGLKATLSGGIQSLNTFTDFARIGSLSFFSTIVSCVAIVYAVREIGSTSTAVLGALEPVTAVAIGVFAFHEYLTIPITVGIVLIIVAVSLIILSDKITYRINLKHRSRH